MKSLSDAQTLRRRHLGLDERRDIYRLVATGRSAGQIAAALGRHPSTIYRELKRNRHLDEHPLFRGYFPTVAQTMASGRRVRGGKITRRPELAATIADRLSAAWSPEQIAGCVFRPWPRSRTAFQACDPRNISPLWMKMVGLLARFRLRLDRTIHFVGRHRPDVEIVNPRH